MSLIVTRVGELEATLFSDRSRADAELRSVGFAAVGPLEKFLTGREKLDEGTKRARSVLKEIKSTFTLESSRLSVDGDFPSAKEAFRAIENILDVPLPPVSEQGSLSPVRLHESQVELWHAVLGVLEQSNHVVTWVNDSPFIIPGDFKREQYQVIGPYLMRLRSFASASGFLDIEILVLCDSKKHASSIEIEKAFFEIRGGSGKSASRYQPQRIENNAVSTNGVYAQRLLLTGLMPVESAAELRPGRLTLGMQSVSTGIFFVSFNDCRPEEKRLAAGIEEKIRESLTK